MAHNNAALLTAEAYEGLRDEIIRGELRPNERLVEADLAKKYKISRTPIREVLVQLSAEGLVESRRRGWMVHEHGPTEILEIYETRAALEGYAARLAAERATDEQLERLKSINAEAEAARKTSARQHLVEVNDAFHQAIVDAAGNDRLRRMIRQTHEYFFNYQIARLYSDDEAEKSVGQHQELVRLLLAHDADGAERMMRQHIADSLELTLAKVR